MDELIIALFDAEPRRPASVYNLLVGKKTLSTLYPALAHHQLQWLGLLPDLARAEFDAAVAALTNRGALRQQAAGLTRDPAATGLALPEAVQPWMDLPHFTPKFYLAVQVLSEASFKNAQYRPVTPDWSTQAAVRDWVRQGTAGAVAELTAVFTALPADSADRLAGGLVGHDYVGGGQTLTLAARLTELNDFARLLTELDTTPATYPHWARLWGGRSRLLAHSNEQALAMAQAGANRQQIQSALRRKISTVNEHLLIGAIFGAEFPLTQFYSPAMLAAFSALPPGPHDYHQLLAQVPGSEFFQVRLYQILQRQGRWPK